MEYTSAEANKLLRKLREEHAALISKESKASSFIISLGEDPESVRPEYDYLNTQKELKEVEQKIIKLKHAISIFNVNTEVPGFDMTIDQLLVYIPQLTERKTKLAKMSDRIPKQRASCERFYGNSNIVEYDYANYDIQQATLELTAVAEELSKAQTSLDLINSTKKFNIVF